MNKRITRALIALGLALVLPACGGSDAEEVVEHPSVVVTQWNDSTELFLEYPVPLAGQAMGNWAIHLSNMKNFKAITEGVLTVRFLLRGREVGSFTLDAPARDGIYLIDPLITQAGSYEVQLALRSPQVSSLHVLPEVQVYAVADEIPPPEAEDPGGISFLKEQQWKIDFAVEPAEVADVERTVTAPGEIVAPDGALAIVTAPISGIAQAVPNQGSPSVGMAVSAGQLLAILAPAAEEGGYARARGELERLIREAERAERLYAAGAIPEKRLEEARHDLEIATAEIAAIGGGIGDGDFRLRIRAPFSGVVAARGFVPGGRVEAGTPLYTVVDSRRLWLSVRLPAEVASTVTQSARAVFTVEGSPVPVQTARVVSIGSVVDSTTRTLPVVFEVSNPAGVFKIGQFARVSVPVGGIVRGVAIPNEAILDENGSPVAYVQAAGETFERRVLSLGENDGVRTQVVDGILRGEMVVTVGAYQVRLASLSPEGFSGGHAH